MDDDGWGTCATTVEFKAGEEVMVRGVSKDLETFVRVMDDPDVDDVDKAPDGPIPETAPPPDPAPESKPKAKGAK